MKLKNKHIVTLNEAIMKYVSIFEKKQNLRFDYWLGNQFGEIGEFNSYCINFSDIRIDLEYDIPKHEIIEWYNDSLELAMKDEQFINYYHWLLRKGYKLK